MFSLVNSLFLDGDSIFFNEEKKNYNQTTLEEPLKHEITAATTDYKHHKHDHDIEKESQLTTTTTTTEFHVFMSTHSRDSQLLVYFWWLLEKNL